MHCNSLQGSTGKYRENPVMKTGTLQWKQGSPVMKAGFALWKLTYREFPVSYTGFEFTVCMYKIVKVAWEISNTVWNGLLKYCISDLFLSKLQLCLLKTNPALITTFNCMMGCQKTMMSAEVSLWNFDNAIDASLNSKSCTGRHFYGMENEIRAGFWPVGNTVDICRQTLGKL